MFKVGDRVMQTTDCTNTLKGSVYPIAMNKSGELCLEIAPGDFGCTCSGQWKLVESSNNIIMSNLVEKFALAVMTEPNKSLRKAGITNGDNLLTEEGQRVFLSWLLSKNAAEFKTEVVDPILAEEEKK